MSLKSFTDVSHPDYTRRGEGVFCVLSRGKRKEFISEVHDVIADLSPTIICILIDKEKYYAKYSKHTPGNPEAKKHPAIYQIGLSCIYGEASVRTGF